MADNAALIVREGGAEAFGLRTAERLRRQLARLGITEAPAGHTATMALRGDHVYGASVLRALADARPGTALTDADGRAVAVRADPEGFPRALDLIDTPSPTAVIPRDLTARTGAELAGRYDEKLRKRSDPMVMDAQDAGAVERALFAASYKGVTDLVTKHVWPRPALAAVRFCVARAITPNQVTYASIALVAIAFALFWQGLFLWGLAAAWAMTFLDTVDGKLARVTLTASRLGDVLDHGVDLLHPPFWWWAWVVGCASAGQPVGNAMLVVAIIVGGYVLQRGEEGLFLVRFGIEMHIWRRFDSLFREITARRNPNLLILTVAALLSAPASGIVAVAVWTALSLLVHLVRIGQAFAASARGDVRSWLAEA